MSKLEPVIRGAQKTIQVLQKLGCRVRGQMTEDGQCIGIVAECCPSKAKKHRGGKSRYSGGAPPNNIIFVATKGNRVPGLPAVPVQNVPPMSYNDIQRQCEIQGMIYDPQQGTCVMALTDEGAIPMQPTPPMPGQQVIQASDLGAIQQNIAQLRSMVAEKQQHSQTKVSFYDVVQQQLDGIIASLQQLGQRNVELTSTNDQLGTTIAQLQAEKDDLYNNLQQCTADKNSLLQEIEELKARLASAMKTLADNERTIGELQIERSQLKQALEQLQGEMAGIVSERNELLASINNLKADMAQLQQEREQVTVQAQTNIAEIKSMYDPEIAQLKAQLQDMNTKEGNYTTLIANLQNIIKTKQAEIDEVKSGFSSENASIKNEMAAIQAQYVQLQQENQALKNEIESIQAEKQQSLNDYAAIKAALDKCQVRHASIVDFINNKMAELQELLRS